MQRERTASFLRENGAVSAENSEQSRSFSAAGNPTTGPPPPRYPMQAPAPAQDTRTNHEDDEDDGDGGFDLSKGFAPIAGGSFHSQRSTSLGVARAGS